MTLVSEVALRIPGRLLTVEEAAAAVARPSSVSWGCAWRAVSP